MENKQLKNYTVLSRRQIMQMLQVLDKDRKQHMEMSDCIILEGVASTEDAQIQMTRIKFRLP